MEGSVKPSPEFIVAILVLVAVGIGVSFGVCTQDDAFISFRYAENLAAGNGLVFNEGERVEGFTNLSWTVLFALIIWLGGEPVMASVFLGWITIGMLVVVTSRLAHQSLGGWSAVVAAGFVALDSPMILEGVEGLETVAYACLITAGILAAWRDEAHSKSTVWFSLATITRPEAPLLWFGTRLSILLRDGFSAQGIRTMVRTSWPLMLTLVSITIWRLQYFGDWLPNTFYAKTGGFPIERGLMYIADYASSHPILGLLVLGALGVKRVRSMTPIVGLVLLYIVSVGGDFKPTGRFFIPILPVLAVLAAGAVQALWSQAALRTSLFPVLVILFCWFRSHQYGSAQSWAAERHANLQARQLVGDWIAQNTPTDTVLAMHSVGVVPYFAGRRTIDMWGLTNREVARTEVPNMGAGMAGHERSAPEYVFSLRPDMYLPEDKMFTRRPWALQPEPGVSTDFAQHYRAVNVPIEGRWLNMWVRKDGLFRGLQRAQGAIEQ